MSLSPKYPLKEIKFTDEVVSVPHIRPKFRYKEGIMYTITEQDIRKDRSQIWMNLAEKFYGNPNLWTVLMDNNPLIMDFHIESGFEVFIPNIF